MKNIFTTKILICLALFIVVLIAFIKIKNEKPITEDLVKNDGTLRICHINQWDGFTPGGLGAIDKYFTDRYQVKYVENNCDVTIAGPYNKEKVKPEPKSIKIWYTGEAQLPRVTYWERIKSLFAGEFMPKLHYWDLVIGFNRINHDKFFITHIIY